MLVEDEIVGLKSAQQTALKPAPTGLEGEGTLNDAVRDLITSYHDLNPSTIDILHEEPSPLEFMRYVARNRPFVIRSGAKDWKARKRWTAAYLTNVMAGQNVNVATTPHGNADSVISLPSGGSLFVKPYETEQRFESVIHAIQQQELETDDYDGPTRYAQTQNDNLRNEYETLFADVPASIPFARIALEKDPDAINFWLGNSHSVTALHKDNYENVYVQVLGKKHFVLLPPVEAPCINEKAVLAATYAPRDEAVSGDEQEGVRKEDLRVRIDDPEEYVPFATFDPDHPGQNANAYSQFSRPLRVTLDEGDMLYLPALWYHKVSQSCSDEGICCAVNYWYDLDFSGGFWSMANFTRSVGLLSIAGNEIEAKVG
ncbi:Clavaminate synthase-like protein [Cucurbitaria berberidis CBS 394.84]|uniref:Clavaminate synthase-like protein n=1 Tax=Cucurbitaria berberidis CBS 394.84 TaxID=1168544 RepID=A0A9P4LB96_9PLEO|nr:Clavaminate synthase-like protein [Cucurbitaria berberidis CBS 394.84]KAF1849336.1 Clavaminate synthase-like protein [Cucurbitaria berberidis CBS 394.84]